MIIRLPQIEYLIHLHCAEHLIFWYRIQELFGKCRCSNCSVLLPLFILVRVRIVANPSYDDTWEVVHQAGRFHLETEHVAKIIANFISLDATLYHLIARCNQPVM